MTFASFTDGQIEMQKSKQHFARCSFNKSLLTSFGNKIPDFGKAHWKFTSIAFVLSMKKMVSQTESRDKMPHAHFQTFLGFHLFINKLTSYWTLKREDWMVP